MLVLTVAASCCQVPPIVILDQDDRIVHAGGENNNCCCLRGGGTDFGGGTTPEALEERSPLRGAVLRWGPPGGWRHRTMCDRSCRAGGARSSQTPKDVGVGAELVMRSVCGERRWRKENDSFKSRYRDGVGGIADSVFGGVPARLSLRSLRAARALSPGSLAAVAVATTGGWGWWRIEEPFCAFPIRRCPAIA